jgi:hypothetical protein
VLKVKHFAQSYKTRTFFAIFKLRSTTEQMFDLVGLQKGSVLDCDLSTRSLRSNVDIQIATLQNVDKLTEKVGFI